MEDLRKFFEQGRDTLQLLKAEPDFSGDIRYFVKRDDLLHPEVSGNKWRKLKYNLMMARASGMRKLLTFGGAYSNHIAAVAGAGKIFGFETVGIIRGEAPAPLNPTLEFARSCGMELQYISREAYRQRQEIPFREEVLQRFGPAYLLPEGGTNCLAIKGCASIPSEIERELGLAPDFIAVSAGTGGTAAGIIAGAAPMTKVLVFSALKGDFLKQEITKLLGCCHGAPAAAWELISDYHFGGYAKVNPELMAFMEGFEKRHAFLLDPVYTAKMFYGLKDMMGNGYFPKGSTLVAIHTGGLQGRQGFNLAIAPAWFPTDG